MSPTPMFDIEDERQFLIDAGVLLSPFGRVDEIKNVRSGSRTSDNATSESSSTAVSCCSKSSSATDVAFIVPSKNITVIPPDYMMKDDNHRKTVLICNTNRMIVLLCDDSEKIVLYTKPITFQTLPTEIRGRIYDEVFIDETYEVMNWIPTNARRPWEYLDFAAITVVNKQCRAESLNAFRKHCDVHISDVMAAYYTVNPSLGCRHGIFDATLLQKITIDFTPEDVRGWPKLRDLLVDFPQLRSLTIKCLITDVFDWRRVDLLEYHPDMPNQTGFSLRGSLTNSTELRKRLFGNMMGSKTKLAQAVDWVEAGFLKGENNNHQPRLAVVVRMRVYAYICRAATPTAFGTLVADVRGKELRYEGSGKSPVVELESWTKKKPLAPQTGELGLIPS